MVTQPLLGYFPRKTFSFLIDVRKFWSWAEISDKTCTLWFHYQWVNGDKCQILSTFSSGRLSLAVKNVMYKLSHMDTATLPPVQGSVRRFILVVELWGRGCNYWKIMTEITHPSPTTLCCRSIFHRFIPDTSWIYLPIQSISLFRKINPICSLYATSYLSSNSIKLHQIDVIVRKY